MSKRFVAPASPCACLVLLLSSVPLSAQDADPGRDRVRGALWGGGIGLVGGAVLGGLSAGSDEPDPTGLEAAATGESVLLGAVLGAGIGAVLGATVFAPSRRAEAGSSATSVSVTSRPTAAGLTFGLALRLRL